LLGGADSGPGGQGLLLTYRWEHQEDGAQDGVLLVGSAAEGANEVTAAWGDSWHPAHPGQLAMEGTSSVGRTELSADYGGGWRWQIAVEVGERLALTMSNVIPKELATEEAPAGPYAVMLAPTVVEGG